MSKCQNVKSKNDKLSKCWNFQEVKTSKWRNFQVERVINCPVKRILLSNPLTNSQQRLGTDRRPTRINSKIPYECAAKRALFWENIWETAYHIQCSLSLLKIDLLLWVDARHFGFYYFEPEDDGKISVNGCEENWTIRINYCSRAK